MVTRNVRGFLAAIGRKGGRARARKLSAVSRSAQARRAAVSRWMRVRFGVENFKALSLPGWELVDPGLYDLAGGHEMTVCALAVAELRPRLRFLGVPVPEASGNHSSPREALYRTMEAVHGEMVHERFSALLSRLDSFCDTLASMVTSFQRTPQRDRMWCA